MPRYTRRAKKFKGFDSAGEILQYLHRTPQDAKTWQHFQAEAGKLMESSQFHRHKLRRVTQGTPHTVARHVLHELHRKRRGDEIGGGILELFRWLGDATRIPGAIAALMPSQHAHNPLHYKQQQIAYAVDVTYKDVSQRPDRIGELTRVPEYDTGRHSVWQQLNGQYLVTVHGTKLEAGDLWDDAKISAGAMNIQDEGLNQLLSAFEAKGIKFDIAGHSLATEFITNTHLQNADEIMLFNPASSPLQSTDELTQRANDERFTYFLNPSDLVSSGLYYQMTNETANNNHIGHYNFSPIAAHSLDQWYDASAIQVEEQMTAEQKQEFEDTADARAKWKRHLRGNILMNQAFATHEPELDEDELAELNDVD